eukprot:TRINITY_DN568_c0_g1_i1.p1 TRINITY_DN568_c0_g1~~TRINITY_DN568_c0_g1_i1.p1  ORF type:complete len:988 (-),score=228.24 TRINITY_DN568_c0_g1_i1:43-3006(-)
MKTTLSIALLLLIALLFSPAESFTSGINSVVYTLGDYQTESGGFRLTKDSEPSLEATEHALFLSALFGLRDKINSGKVSAFVQTLNNPDHGYSNQPGKQSDLESVRYALLILNHLGNHATMNTAGVAAFIQSLYDSDTKLFSNTFGGSGDIKSTAIAFQCFSMLNLLQSSEVLEKAQAIKNHLQELVKGDAFTKYFFSLTSDNYYSIVVASHVGFEFGDLKLWARYFVERQVKDGTYMGGFFSDQTGKELSSEDASHALSALDILQRLSTTTPPATFTDNINTANLIRYANTLPRSLRAAAAAFTALARTSAFQSTFKITTHYDVLDPRYRPVGDRIIQGTQLKPVLNVRTHYGLAHAGLDVSVTITHKSTGDKAVRKLTWNADSQTYVTDEFYSTSDKLGELTLDYVIRWLVVDLGNQLSISISEKKSIGYDLSIRSRAVHAGKDVESHGVVGVGTEFAFNLQLGTLKQPKPSLLYGDFKVTFSVLDASFVVIHRSQYSPPSGNNKPIHFTYILDHTNIPGGDLTFHFAVSNSDGIHTNDSVSYVLPLTMVASEIKFEGFESADTATYQIGDTVIVKMKPASLPDLRTVQYYKSKDYLGKEVDRNFFMDVSSSETQATLFSLPGYPKIVDDTIEYTFKLPVAPTFDAIGTNVISFRYETAKTKSIVLQNYDSKQGELFEDGKHLTYSVKTELHLTQVKDAPKDGELQYGNEVKLTFQVIDEISKKLVWAGSEKSTAYLVLRHKEENRALPFTSNKQKAVEVTKQGVPAHFSVVWSINPNAVMGDGYLELVAQGADGKEIPIFEEKSKQQWRVNVKIGGTITVEDKKFSSEINEEDTVFLVEFDLSCRDAKLSDARLKAVVRYVLSGKTTETVVRLPVTQSKQGGRYEISWIQPTEHVKSGQYLVDFYREVDRKRVSETTNSAEEEEIESKLNPLFTISFYHQGGALSFPLKLEVVSMMVLGGAFFWMVWQKMELEGTRKTTKKNKK